MTIRTPKEEIVFGPWNSIYIGPDVGKKWEVGFHFKGLEAEGGLTSRTLSGLEETASEIRKQGKKALPISCDVTDPKSGGEMVNRTLNEFGKINILITSAGIALRSPAEEIEPTIEKIKITMDLKKAASKAQFVIEAVSEKLELKQKIFRDLDSLCPPETVDEVIKKGFGIRLPVLGPLENADMVGLDLTMAIHDYILKHLERSPNTSPLLKEKVERGELGFKTGQGFQKWSLEEVQRSRTELLEYLLKWTKGQREN